MSKAQAVVYDPKMKSGADLIERVVMTGDLSQLTPENRLLYYAKVCESLSINPLTKPFDYLNLNGKLILYANRNCTEQLRRVHQVSIKIVAREKVDEIYVVTAQATDKTGRIDEAIGAVNLAGLKGEALANAFMKAETKAKRRLTLSICGTGMLDETETVTIPGAKQIRVDAETGEILDPVTSVHKPGDGAESRVAAERKNIVMDCVTAAKECLASDNAYGAYEILSGLTDPDERVWANDFFDSADRALLKKQESLARLDHAQKVKVQVVVEAMNAHLEDGNYLAAVMEYKTADLDGDEMVFMWTFFDNRSKDRNAMKKALAEANKKAQSASA